MVEHVVRALLARERQPFRRAGGADHPQAVRARELHGRGADAAARAVHQHRLARAGLGAEEERAPRRRIRHAERRALRERDPRRQRMRLRLVADEQLSVAARGAVRVDAVAGLEGGHARADLLDGAGDVGAGGVGKIGLARVGAGADVGVDRVHADGVDANEDLAGPGRRVGHVLELHDIGGAEFADDNRLHARDCMSSASGRPPAAGAPFRPFSSPVPLSASSL